jgi:hypothetical protein
MGSQVVQEDILLDDGTRPTKNRRSLGLLSAPKLGDGKLPCTPTCTIDQLHAPCYPVTNHNCSELIV